MHETSRSAPRGNTSARMGMGVGTTSILMIFTVLAFATLALLSLSTSASNMRIQQRGTNRTVALAAAEGAAAAKLAELDAALSGIPAGGAYEDAALAAAEGAGFTVDNAAKTATYISSIDDNDELVTVVAFPGAGTPGYRLVSQVSRYTGEWTPEGGGGFWQG